MVGVKESQIAIVQHLIDTSESSDVFDQGVLLLSLFLIAGSCIEVAKFRDEDRHRHNRNGLLIEHNRFLIPAIVGPELAQGGQYPIVTRMNVERCKVSRIGRRYVSSLRLVLSQLVVQPCKILAFE